MEYYVTAQVAVDKASMRFDKQYTYVVPESLAGSVVRGARVIVPFGGGNRKRQAVVLALDKASSISKLKPIAEVIEGEALSEERLELVSFIKEHTLCTWFEAVRLVLPTGLNMDITRVYSLNKDKLEASELDETERAITDWLSKKRKPAKEKQLTKELDITHKNKTLQQLISRGIVTVQEQSFRRVADEKELMVRLVPWNKEETTPRLSEKQKSVITLLQNCTTASVKEINYYTEASKSTIDSLVKKDMAQYFTREVLRTPYGEQTARSEEFTLNDEQQKAYGGLKDLMESGSPNAALLYGVTGSGKTHIFIKLIERAVKNGRQAIMLVPEISLTPQTISRFRGAFGDKVAVLHSGLSLGERLDEYKRMKSGEAVIAVGTRSAVFAPFNNIGLVIIDEEQEHTYKSESSPRYHARDVAKFICAKSNALLLLASATPSVETYYNALHGRYSLFTLSGRYGTADLPEVVIVNMSDEANRGNISPISSALAEEIEYNLDHGEQTILLLNRRGFNTLAVCGECEKVITCPNCSIALTYHRANDKMMCHYCGYIHSVQTQCSECGSHKIKYLGMGTQRIETVLGDLFPTARILRMDMDTTMSKFAHEELLSAFGRGEYDILIGTQMVAKGLDFEKVSLVGVLSAESSLYSTDFRCQERAFSLLTQVVGRSGRGKLKGRAYIQTYLPDNEVIELAARQDYKEFYEGEILCRKNLVYPPFCSFCVVGFSGIDEAVTAKASYEYLKILKQTATADYPAVPLKVLGPCPATVVKVSGKYRYRIIIKCRDSAETRNLLRASAEVFEQTQYSKNTSMFIDINYNGMI